MKCSIVIPYYQRRELLFNTLYSLNNQINMDNTFEVIVIDDGSDDLSLKDIEQLDLNIDIKYFKYPRSERSGAAFARNKGIEKAKGEFVIFLDCDQIVKSDFVYEHYKFHENANTDDLILQIGMRNDLHEGQIIDIYNINKCTFDIDCREKVFEIYSENMACLKGSWHLVFSNNISISRSILDKYGGFDENFKGWGLEDCEFGYRMFKQGVKILYNPNIEAFHQYHEFIWSEERVEGWKRNINYFIQKYYELPVMMQLIIGEYVDPITKKEMVKRNRLERYDEEGKWLEIWLNSYERFENSLRSKHTNILNNCARNMTIKNPTISELEYILANEYFGELIVLCPKNNIDLIIWIQTSEKSSSVKLYTY